MAKDLYGEVIKMGTRAVIKFEGKPMLATHWDGYPESLGAELVAIKDKTPEKVIKVASLHNIDFISPKFTPKKKLVVPKQIYNMKTGKYVKGQLITEFLTDEEMDRRNIQGTFIPTKGKTERKYSTIAPMSQYGDFAEWEYDIKDGKVLARRIVGSYPDKKAESSWKSLPTQASAKKFQKQIEDKIEKEYMAKEREIASKLPTYGAIKINKQMASSWSGSMPVRDITKKDLGESAWGTVTYNDKLSDYDRKIIKNYLSVPKVRKKISLGKGWHFESLRHKLASFGIKTNYAKGNKQKLYAMYKMAKRRR